MPDELQALNNIKDRIYNILGVQVMLDSDLAELYTVETKNLNRASSLKVRSMMHINSYQIFSEVRERR